MLNRIRSINKHIVAIVAFALVLVVPFFRLVIPVSDDLPFHIPRFLGTIAALKDGQLIPQVDPTRLGGLGLAINENYPPLPAYVFIAIKLLVRDYAVAYFIFLFVVIVGAGLLMRLFILRVTKNQTTALVSALVYMSTPYFLHDVFMRGSVGEYCALVFAPLLFLGLYEVTHPQLSLSPLSSGSSLAGTNSGNKLWELQAVLHLSLGAEVKRWHD